MDHTIRIRCQLFVVGNDNESLVHLVAQFEKEAV